MVKEMHVLFQSSLNNVVKITIAREKGIFMGDMFFYDQHIKEAILSYYQGETISKRVSSFIESLEPIFNNFYKGMFVDIFLNFMRHETFLEKVLPKHVEHFDRSIQVFLLGYNILTNWPFIFKKHFDIEETFYSWLVTSLFHDFGYYVEKINEVCENLEKELTFFTDYTLPQIKISPLQINIKDEDLTPEIIEDSDSRSPDPSTSVVASPTPIRNWDPIPKPGPHPPPNPVPPPTTRVP